MKKLFTLVLAAMAFVACTQNDVEELTDNRVALPETLTVGFEGGDTRVELNEALKTVWTEGDEVSVYFYSDANQKWQYQGETGERLGTLRRVDAGVATTQTDYVVVAYPYNTSYTLNRINANLIASLPAVQSYKDGSYGAEGNIMVAQSEFTQFSLKSVCGWLRVELTGEGEVVESVKVRGNNGEQVAGLIYVDTATAEATLASEMGEASDEEQVGGVGGGLEFDNTVFTEVTLDCGNGVELGAEATAFYIALLPQTFEKGMTIYINYANAGPQTLVCENVITIQRNHISPIGIEANEEADVPSNQLWYTATALVEPYDASGFNVAIVSNEWDETTGEGVITFDGKLTTIGEQAFRNCDSLTSVTIGDSVTTIGGYAFYDCTSLTSVTIGDSVTTIGNDAFRGCLSLTSVTIPDSVTMIGFGAFDGCSNLTSVTIPDSVTTIGEAAFGGCSNLAEFKGKFAADGGRCLIKDNTIIAYAEASGTTYTIPDGVTTILGYAFDSCSSLTSVTIPDSVTTIGRDAFWGCDSLTSVTIPDSVTTIGEAAFYKCTSLTSVTIPDSVTTIGDGAFAGCKSLAEFKGKFAEDGGRCLIKDNTIIAYANASGTTYTIPDSVTTIGNDAFRSCYSLTSVTIGDSVTTIGDMAFYYCSSLTSVYCEATTPPTLDGSFVFYSNKSGRKIYVPTESVGAYMAAAGWSEYADYIVGYNFETGEEEEVPTNQLWYTATALVKPNSSAFNVAIVSNEWDETTGEGAITFDGELTTIGYYAFGGCSSLTSVTIPDSVTTIGDYAFNYCESLTSVTIGDSVTTIGYAAFAYCYDLTSVTIPDSVTTIGDGVFAVCSNLAEFKGKFAADGGRCLIIDGVLNAFAFGCGVTEYTIPDSVTSIGNYVFYGCSSLTSITISDSVTTIGDNAFQACTNLTSVYCKATTPPTLGLVVFDDNAAGRKIYVTAESVEAYKAAENWSEYAAKIVGYNFETGEVVE